MRRRPAPSPLARQCRSSALSFARGTESGRVSGYTAPSTNPVFLPMGGAGASPRRQGHLKGREQVGKDTEQGWWAQFQGSRFSDLRERESVKTTNL